MTSELDEPYAHAPSPWRNDLSKVTKPVLVWSRTGSRTQASCLLGQDLLLHLTNPNFPGPASWAPSKGFYQQRPSCVQTSLTIEWLWSPGGIRESENQASRWEGAKKKAGSLVFLFLFFSFF